MSNPLLSHQFLVPFDQVQAEHVEPAVDQLIEEARKRIDEITKPGPRTYENTMHALDECTEPLDYAMHVVGHLEAVATYPALREAYNNVQPRAAEFYSSIPLNAELWTAIKAFAETEEAKSLAGARKRFLEKTMADFRRHGADLDAEGKRKLQEIDIELTQLTTKFSQNVLDATNAYETVIKDESSLAGLPESAMAAAKQSAQAKGIDGWRFTLQAPSYIPVMTYLDDRSIRESLYRAFNKRAAGGDLDNRENTVRILGLRKQKAKLLSFHDFADFVLEDRMAHNGERAQQFLEDLREKTEAAFHRENLQLQQFAGGKELMAWDVGYWAEKERQALYDFDEEELRPYFPVQRVVAGMFDIFQRVLEIRVREQSGVPVWDPEVKYYVIQDDAGRRLGAFYADWYPRENKRGGAWMDTLITGIPAVDPDQPHLGLICGNLTPPVGDKPALLTHREVETIFHEFGHLLHHCLSRVEVKSLAGTNVPWDFVELPSQIMENWCWERESLDLFARHYETGEPIPEELFQKMRRARTFRSGNAQMRQLSLGTLDLKLHREYDPERDGSVVEYSRRILQQFAPTPLTEDHAMIAGFTHLFSSPVAYGAGYYSYKWAEVLDADAFTRFKRAGVFDSDVGREYRDKILARGNSEDPAELYRSFMGRDPDPNALLERAGLQAA
jgi:oligopeptidase A